jgi:colanic acid/amylovoran biosynthesis glycosyltransferase
MKIAFIVNKFPAISETFVLNQITGLMDMGHQVEIFASYSSSETKVHSDIAKYDLMNHTHYCAAVPKNKMICRLKTLFLIALNSLRSPMSVAKALKILLFDSKEFSYPHLYFVFLFLGKKFDIIHAHFGHNGLIGVLLKSTGIGSGLCVTFHGNDMSTSLARYGDKIYEDLFENGDIFMPISEFWKEKLICMGSKLQKIVVHRMGIDSDKFEFAKKTTGPQGQIELLTVGRLVEKKGHEYSIKAVAELVNRNFNIRLTIAGDGPLRNDLQDLVSNLRLERYIRFYGPAVHSQILNLYRDSHIFILPSVTAADGDMEGIPVVLMEAMAAGLPAVSTYHSGIPELIKNGTNGFLVPEKDVDALAEKLEYLITHPENWPKIGAASREYVQKNYDIKILNQKLIKIYKSLL